MPTSRRRLLPALLLAVAASALAAGPASGGGGLYVFDGATPTERARVTTALEASAFDWSVVSQAVVIHVRSELASSYATPGHVWLDRRLLASGRFAWPVVQHEYAHQVDFLALDDEARATLLEELGGRDWCYRVTGLQHGAYGCERFASTLVRSYWAEHDSVWPAAPAAESRALPSSRFRALLESVLERRSPFPSPAPAGIGQAPPLLVSAPGRRIGPAGRARSVVLRPDRPVAEERRESERARDEGTANEYLHGDSPFWVYFGGGAGQRPGDDYSL